MLVEESGEWTGQNDTTDWAGRGEGTLRVVALTGGELSERTELVPPAGGARRGEERD